MINQFLIIGFKKNILVKKKDKVYLICKILDRKFQVLVLNKVEYIPNIDINFILQEQIYQKDLHKLEIKS